MLWPRTWCGGRRPTFRRSSSVCLVTRLGSVVCRRAPTASDLTLGLLLLLLAGEGLVGQQAGHDYEPEGDQSEQEDRHNGGHDARSVEKLAYDKERVDDDDSAG